MQANITQILSQSRLMAGVPFEIMESLAGRFGEMRDVPAGEVFKKSSDEADAAFLVRSGNVQVSESGGLSNEVYAYTVGQGEILGALALLDSVETGAEYRAAEDTTLAALPRPVFNEWLTGYPEYREALLANTELDRQYHFLRRTQLFNELNAIDLYALARELSPCFERHDSGDYLFHENEGAQAAFLMASGEYRIIKESAEDTVVATLGPGALTGVAGLLQHGVYTAAIRVPTP